MIPIHERSKSAKVYLRDGTAFVFSEMVVDHLGNTPSEYIGKVPAEECDHSLLGKLVRTGIDRARPWVEYAAFEKEFHGFDPVASALGFPNEVLDRENKRMGTVSISDLPGDATYELTAWVRKGKGGEGLETKLPDVPKNCADEELGEIVLELARASLDATLLANRKG